MDEEHESVLSAIVEWICVVTSSPVEIPSPLILKVPFKNTNSIPLLLVNIFILLLAYIPLLLCAIMNVGINFFAGITQFAARVVSYIFQGVDEE
jgi:hypothetical protein